MEHEMDLKRVGLIGLGLMGTALTERLLEHGYRVEVWNRTRAKADPLLSQGAVWSDNPFVSCNRVIISLYTTEVVLEVLNQFWHTLQPGQLILDTTTGEPEQTTELGKRLAAQRVQYLDAPISGSSQQTRNGDVTVIVGGEKDAFEKCADLWSAIGSKVFHVGPCGSAAKMKLISNHVLGLNRAVLAEGLALAEALGVAPAEALKVLSGSNAYSRAMDVKGRKMIERDYTVQAKLSQHLKDVNLMLQAASAAGISLPLVETHKRLMEQAEAAGLGEQDNSVILEILRKPSVKS